MNMLPKIFSSRSSSRPNANTIFLMDNLFAIAFGLGLRFVVDTVSHNDFKLTGTLVGLWEGVVTLHFLKKMPKSFDPYIAYVVRLFVDFLVTESVIRLVLVVVWSGMGMVLADIAPAIWHDVGGHRIWRRFRRDMYYMSRSVPNIPPLFPRARVVRFSPVIEPTEISETISTLSPTAATPTVGSRAPTTRIIPPTPSPPRIIKRPVPGRFPASVISETDTDATSVADSRPPVSPVSVGTSHVRYTVQPRRSSIDLAVHSPSASVDDSNISSQASSVSTETPSLPNQVDLEIEIPVYNRDKGKGKERDDYRDEPEPPTQRSIILPPTPSDSYRPHFVADRSSIVPTITGMPSIPDFFESGLGSDWENIHKEEAGLPPTPPAKDFDSPPVHYIPPPSVYVPTPRPLNFDQDLWDDTSNAASPAPQTRTPKQRHSRLPPTSSMIKLTAEPLVSQPVKKPVEPVPPPQVPQTPLYGDAWDTEQDQLPPQTPSVLARTPMYDHAVDLNNEPATPLAESSAILPPDQDQGVPEAPVFIPEQQDPMEFSFMSDDPWPNPTPEEQEQVEPKMDVRQESQSKRTAPPTPRIPTQTPPTPQLIKQRVPSTPQYHPGTVPSTPQRRPETIPPTPQQRPGTVPPTPQQPLKPVPPQPESVIATTSRELAGATSSTPQQKLQTVPPTPQQRTQTVPPSPQPQLQPVPPTPQVKSQTVPATPQKKPQTAPPTPQQKSRTVPPTPQQKPQAVPSTPQQKPQAVPPTPQQKLQSVPPTPQQKLQSVPPTPQQKLQPVPPTPQPVPPTPVSPPPQQHLQTLLPALEQSPSPQTDPMIPQQQLKTVPPTPAPRQSQDLFQDLVQPVGHSESHLFDDLAAEVDKLGGGPDLDLHLLGGSQQQSRREETLVDVGGDDVNEEENKSPQDGDNANDGVDGEGEGPPVGEVQFDAQNNPLSPASSGYSSAAGVPSEIKERNKSAIIIRAQIFELTNVIEELKEEKLKAQGKEELDPLSEESTLKGQEIQRAERSLEKLKKRAEKRHQAAVDSTRMLTLGKTVTLNFEETSPEVAAARLEDVLGLFFGPERKTMKIEITVSKGGAGKAVKAAIQKVLGEYGIKSIAKMGGVNVTAMARTYTDIITSFRQLHSKEDDS